MIVLRVVPISYIFTCLPPCAGKPPLRRYQRSLTDTAFIFSKASEDSSASSPRSPPLVSPFSRGPASPVFRETATPPASPDFRPDPRPPKVSPPPSPVHSAPPVAALPSLPPPVTAAADHQRRRCHSASEDPAPAVPTSPPPLQPSAPPASLLASCPPGDDSRSLDGEAGAVVMPPDLLMTPPENQAPCSQVLSPDTPPFAPDTPPLTPTPQPSSEVDPVPQAPTAALPVSPQSNKVAPPPDLCAVSPGHTEPDSGSDSGYIAQAVLVEEEEEEEEEEEVEEEEEEDEVTKGEGEPTPEPPRAPATPPLLQPVTGQDETLTAQETEPEPEPEAAVEEPVVMEPEEEEGGAEDDGQENDQPECTQAPEEPIMCVFIREYDWSKKIFVIHLYLIADTETNGQQITEETVIVSNNGFTNGDTVEEIGIEGSLIEEVESSPKLVVYCQQHKPIIQKEYIEVEEEMEENDEEENEKEENEEEEQEEEEEVEISENGQEDIMDTQMCVRALYDYQAEDDSEISFEPGDIISDVETVDKAWWRGCKDGRQGLFPANYCIHTEEDKNDTRIEYGT
ncbi:Drebrin-like protein B [Merluccius polli]|uniref:Drebrin-like protein B n=1 Tax=Merluccius polli TaxID=89951 RepID=A0AA47M7Z9_MERPO|nr:Drebrin-like protein B [Merluccius polli]